MSLAKLLYGIGEDAFRGAVSSTKKAAKNAVKGMNTEQKKVVTKHVEDQIEEGNILTDSAVKAVKKNVQSGLNPSMGLAAQVSKGSTATEFFGGGSMVGAVIGGGLLGIGGAAITDSNKTEGAFYGALAGASLGGLARHAAKNIGTYEESFMKSLLGKKYITGKNLKTKGQKIVDLDDNLSLEDLGLSPKQRKGATTVGEYKTKLKRPKASKITAKKDLDKRKTNIKALEAMDTSGMGTIDKYKRDLLLGKSNLNVGRIGRMSTMGGAALAGMAFSSSQRDHRRGFNKRRGNRV